MPGSFSREVWQRGAARQAMREEAFWPRVVQWFSTQLVRPQYATPLVILSLSASIGVAHVQALEANAKLAQKLEIPAADGPRYLEMMTSRIVEPRMGRESVISQSAK